MMARMGNVRALHLRKLAAIDIAFLGFKFVFAEYASGLALSAALGVFVLIRSHSAWQVALGIYFICLGINYVPMFAYAVSIASRENALAELGSALAEKSKAMSKYQRMSVVLLVPLSVPILAIGQKPRAPR